MKKLEDNRLKQQIELEKAKHQIAKTSKKRNGDPNLLSISAALDEYYFLNKIQIYCAYLNLESVRNKSDTSYNRSSFALIPETLKHLRSKQHSNPHIKTYLMLLELAEKQEKSRLDSNNIIQIEQQIDSLLSDAHREDKEMVYTLLTNFCIREINEGRHEFLESYILFTNKYLNYKFKKKQPKEGDFSAAKFGNIVRAAINLPDSTIFKKMVTKGLKPENPQDGFKNNSEWVLKFAKYYKSVLDPKSKKPKYLYHVAEVAFLQKNFKKAYKLLSEIENIQLEPFYNLNLKVLSLKVYYELYQKNPDFIRKNKIDIDKKAETLRASLRFEKTNRKLLGYQMEYYTSFEKNFKELLRIYNRYARILYRKDDAGYLKSKNILKERVQKLKHAYREWMLIKIEKL